MRTTAALFLLPLALLAACGDDDEAALEPPSTTTTPPSSTTTEAPEETTTTAAPATTSAPMTVPEGCNAADPADVELVSSGLEGEAASLAEAFTAETAEGRWVAANIYPATGDRLSSADYWIIDQAGAVFSISSSAEDYSTWPRPADGPSLAGGDTASELTDCVVAALRARNTGG